MITATVNRLLLLLAIFVGFSLRLYGLGADSLWYDELVSVSLAHKTVPAMIAHTARDIHPPGYYLLLHAWDAITQAKLELGMEFIFAWPSFFFGLLNMPLLFALARRLHGRYVALVTAWLTAVNPFQIWYSQEVRMYTVGAVLGLVCLWAVCQYLSPVRRGRACGSGSEWLALYVVSAIGGLYTLYYFVLTLISLNAVVFSLWIQRWRIARRNATAIPMSRKSLAGWTAVQVVVLLFWSPWLPIFWRQATDPPVPPWRPQWTWQQFGSDLTEGLSALFFGHTLGESLTQIGAGLGLVVLLSYALTREVPLVEEKKARIEPRLALLSYTLIPVFLIFSLSLLVTPLYHVRYFFIYSPPLIIVVASVVARLYQRTSLLSIAALALLLWFNGFGLYRFWFEASFQADDHRGSVSTLASLWRPSDLILVNAGWAYPVLEVYWPLEASKRFTAVPPPLGEPIRLDKGISSYLQGRESLPATPVVVRSGGVDSEHNLGWGQGESDFFAIGSQETMQALTTLKTCFRRIWHYRIYDTVSDPAGHIRQWLDTYGTLVRDDWIQGRDLGRLQLYAINSSVRQPQCQPSWIRWEAITFGEHLRLSQVAAPSTHTPGRILYVTLAWQPLAALAEEATPLSMSLRLYDVQDRQIAQQDATPFPGTESWATEIVRHQALAIPVPQSTPPGAYTLELIVYRQSDGMPLELPEAAIVTWNQRLRLSHVVLGTFK